MLGYYKECTICHCLYRPLRHSQQTCGAKECKSKLNKLWKKNNVNNKSYRKDLKRRKQKGKVMLLLTQEAIAANNLGLSYGQYKAQQWIRNHEGR